MQVHCTDCGHPIEVLTKHPPAQGIICHTCADEIAQTCSRGQFEIHHCDTCRLSGNLVNAALDVRGLRITSASAIHRLRDVHPSLGACNEIYLCPGCQKYYEDLGLDQARDDLVMTMAGVLCAVAFEKTA